MPVSDLILAYAAIGCSVSAFALVRLLCHGPSMDHIKHAACRSGLPLWAAALLATAALVVVLAEYAALWPLRWREALR